jgi:Raf kinase inhibitor-like YbhB/YbcL family protein
VRYLSVLLLFAACDGGAAALPDAASTPAPDAAAEPDAPATAPDAAPAEAMLTLDSSGFLSVDGERVFPASACAPIDESPPFAWTGAPAGTRSFALTFVDRDNGATKWVVWDLPPDVTMLPANLSKTPHPGELPSASQLGSLNHTGYAGPGVPGPPMHTYEFVLWALDVDTLPGTAGLSTAQIRQQLLPAHVIEQSAPLVAQGQRGGP